MEFRGNLKPRLILSDRSSDVTELLAQDENDNSYNFVGRSSSAPTYTNIRQALGTVESNGGIESPNTTEHENHQKFEPKSYDLSNQSKLLEVIVTLGQKYMDVNPADSVNKCSIMH